jgi:hypothetical protein
MVAKMRAYIEALVKQKLLEILGRLVDRMPGLMKMITDDPEMPGCVARGKDRLIDSVWPDIREEIMWELAVKLDGEKLPDELIRPGVDCFRAFWRYHLFPFDKGIWGKLRDPVFIAFTLCTLLPIYGWAQIIFAFVFIIIDKADEFQLINFILSFKGMQFITMGVIRALQGFAMFMLCTTGRGHPDKHDCEDEGPGTNGAMLISSVAFFLQVILCWIAFLLLPCSEEKGRTTLQGMKYERSPEMGKAGGYIRYFLIWDTFFFVCCLTIPIYTLTTRGDDVKHDDWVLAQAVFAAQVLYGLLSVPFFLFTIPGLQRVLTHAMPTAYDRRGCCRKLQRPSPPKETRQQMQHGDLVSEEDAAGVFEQIRAAIPGMPSLPFSPQKQKQ